MLVFLVLSTNNFFTTLSNIKILRSNYILFYITVKIELKKANESVFNFGFIRISKLGDYRTDQLLKSFTSYFKAKSIGRKQGDYSKRVCQSQLG